MKRNYQLSGEKGKGEDVVEYNCVSLVDIEEEKMRSWAPVLSAWDEIIEDGNSDALETDKSFTDEESSNEALSVDDIIEHNKDVNLGAIIDIEEVISHWGAIICIWKEIRSCPTYFNKIYYVESIVSRFIFPANDIISDFLMAQQMFKSEDLFFKQVFTSLSYFFISLPGIIILYNQLILCVSFLRGRKMQGLLALCIYLVLLMVPKCHSQSFRPLAYSVSAFILLVGFLNIFCHGRTKKLSNIVNGYEGFYESIPQMIMQLIFFFFSEKWNGTSLVFIVCVLPF